MNESQIQFGGYINLNEIERMEGMDMEKIINEAMFDAAVAKAAELLANIEEFRDDPNKLLAILLASGMTAGTIKKNLFENGDEVKGAAAEREDDTKRPEEKKHLTFGQALEAAR